MPVLGYHDAATHLVRVHTPSIEKSTHSELRYAARNRKGWYAILSGARVQFRDDQIEVESVLTDHKRPRVEAEEDYAARKFLMEIFGDKQQRDEVRRERLDHQIAEFQNLKDQFGVLKAEEESNTPTPERVTLTDEERHGLWLREHAPIEATYTAVERILAAREQALREEIAKKFDVLASREQALSTDPAIHEDEQRLASGAEIAYEHTARILRGGAK